MYVPSVTLSHLSTPRKSAPVLRICLGLLIAAYPLAIYFLIDAIDPLVWVCSLGILFVLRLLSVKLTLPQLSVALIAILIFCVAAAFDPQLTVLKLYPVIINLTLASYGIYTVVHPPSAIEKFSHWVGMTVEGPAIPYTRRLTLVWVVFFVVNAAVAAYTALWAATEVWAIYNGFISYLLVGLLIILEYPVRLLYRRRHANTQPGSISEQ